MSKRLRLLSFTVQPVVVWDDGTDLTPGPPMETLSLSLDGLRDMAERFPEQLQRLVETLPEALSATVSDKDDTL